MFNTKTGYIFRIAILIAGVILLAINLFLLDYDALFSRENLGSSFGIVSNLCVIAAMGFSLRHTGSKK